MLAVLLIIVLLIILLPVLPYILKFLFWLICLPFKAIAALFKGIDNRRKRKTEAKAQKEPAVHAADVETGRTQADTRTADRTPEGVRS